jgi:hypothetical protein
MSIDKITVVGGSLRATFLTNKLTEQDYAIGKAYAWLSMLKDRQQPRKWMRPSAKGTNINFDIIMNKEQLEQAQDELELYLKQVNRQFGTDLELTHHKPQANESTESA